MRLIGFSKTKSKAAILVDNPENITHVYNGRWAPQNMVKYEGNSPIFVIHFKTDFSLNMTASSASMSLREKGTNNSYEIYSDSITTLFHFMDQNKIRKDEDGYFIGVVTPVKSGSVVFMALLDPDNLNMNPI